MQSSVPDRDVGWGWDMALPNSGSQVADCKGERESGLCLLLSILFKMVLAHPLAFSQKPSLCKILSRIIQSFDFLIKKKEY